jgi:hypothetical protein
LAFQALLFSAPTFLTFTDRHSYVVMHGANVGHDPGLAAMCQWTALSLEHKRAVEVGASSAVCTNCKPTTHQSRTAQEPTLHVNNIGVKYSQELHLGAHFGAIRVRARAAQVEGAVQQLRGHEGRPGRSGLTSPEVPWYTTLSSPDLPDWPDPALTGLTQP